MHLHFQYCHHSLPVVNWQPKHDLSDVCFWMGKVDYGVVVDSAQRFVIVTTTRVRLCGLFSHFAMWKVACTCVYKRFPKRGPTANKEANSRLFMIPTPTDVDVPKEPGRYQTWLPAQMTYFLAVALHMTRERRGNLGTVNDDPVTINEWQPFVFVGWLPPPVSPHTWCFQSAKNEEKWENWKMPDQNRPDPFLCHFYTPQALALLKGFNRSEQRYPTMQWGWKCHCVCSAGSPYLMRPKCQNQCLLFHFNFKIINILTNAGQWASKKCDKS